MLFLSLGPEVLIQLLQSQNRTEMTMPDLSWLLFGPDTEPCEIPVPPKKPSILQPSK